MKTFQLCQRGWSYMLVEWKPLISGSWEFVRWLIVRFFPSLIASERRSSGPHMPATPGQWIDRPHRTRGSVRQGTAVSTSQPGAASSSAAVPHDGRRHRHQQEHDDASTVGLDVDERRRWLPLPAHAVVPSVVVICRGRLLPRGFAAAAGEDLLFEEDGDEEAAGDWLAAQVRQRGLCRGSHRGHHRRVHRHSSEYCLRRACPPADAGEFSSTPRHSRVLGRNDAYCPRRSKQ